MKFYHAMKRLCDILDIDFKDGVAPEVALGAAAAIVLHMVDEDHGKSR